MPTIKQELSHVSLTDMEFIGTVALKNDKLSLPDGSKVAIGMDDGRWVIVYQQAPQLPFILYEFNAGRNTVVVDKKPGGARDYEKVHEIVRYFFEQAEIDDVVTIEPGGREE